MTALFLDLDNTLMPSQKVYAETIVRLATEWEKRGFGNSFLQEYEEARKIVKDQLTYHSSNRLRLLCFYLIWERKKAKGIEISLGSLLDSNDIQNVLEWENLYFQIFTDLLKKESEKTFYQKELFPLLANLSTKVPVFLATNETMRTQCLKWISFFPKNIRFTLVTSELVGFEKPSTEFFSYLLAKAKKEPKECVMVGDSWEDDILGASRHGIPAIHIQSLETESSLPKSDVKQSPDTPGVYLASDTVSGLLFFRDRFL